MFFTQAKQQMGSLWAVEAAIKFNMPVEVVFQSLALKFVVFNCFDEFGEHLGNGIFSSEEKLTSSVGNAQENGCTSIFIKIFHVLGTLIFLYKFGNISKSILIISQLRNSFDEFSDWLGISPNFFHSPEVKFKMRKVFIWVISLISLFSDNNLIDESSCLYINTWSPKPFSVSEISLEIFNKLEKVPNGPAMPFHKQLQIINCTQGMINWMGVESLLGLLKCWVVEQQGLHLLEFACHKIYVQLLQKHITGIDDQQ